MPQPIKLFLSLALPFLAAALGSAATAPAIPVWFASLDKPFFNPPNWLFAPVWTILYLLMGIALYRVWSSSSPGPETRWQAVSIFFVQLVFNTAWSLAFFGLQSPLLGLGIILLLWLLIIYLIFLFYPLDRLAAYLLLPYLAWVSFASLLNFSLWFLN